MLASLSYPFRKVYLKGCRQSKAQLSVRPVYSYTQCSQSPPLWTRRHYPIQSISLPSLLPHTSYAPQSFFTVPTPPSPLLLPFYFFFYCCILLISYAHLSRLLLTPSVPNAARAGRQVGSQAIFRLIGGCLQLLTQQSHHGRTE
jgi:hypothetical protein